MKIIIKSNYGELSQEAARIVAREIIRKLDPVLGLPTGDTPVGMYQRLIDFYQEGIPDFSHVVTFNLDEYYGLPFDHQKSFHRYMGERFFSQVNIQSDNTYIPNGMTDSVEEECNRYEAEIEAHGGVDLMVLGIGANGHIGFNEPGTPWDSSTRLVNLTQETKKREFAGFKKTPDKAITMGIKTIMKARRILLLASGDRKAEITRKTLEGPIINQVPSTILRLHPNTQLVLDEASAKYLSEPSEVF